MWQLSGLNGDDEEENTGGSDGDGDGDGDGDSDGDGDGDGDAAERDKMWSQHKFAIFWLTAGNPVFRDKVLYFNERFATKQCISKQC